MTVGAENGVITGGGRYPANRREGDIILKRVERRRDNALPVERLGLGAGRGAGAAHRGLGIMGAAGRASLRRRRNNPMKEGFERQPEGDFFTRVKGGGFYFRGLFLRREPAIAVSAARRPGLAGDAPIGRCAGLRKGQRG
jgi:hypothetical protein